MVALLYAAGTPVPVDTGVVTVLVERVVEELETLAGLQLAVFIEQ